MYTTVGQKITYASKSLLPTRRFDEYLLTMDGVLADDIHYIDPVHELHGRNSVLNMLAKYVPRAANDRFQFELIHEDDKRLLWKWTIGIKVRFTPFEFTIHGLVEAHVRDGKIFYQREYYDPMESIGVIPLVGFLYKLILKFG